MGKAIIKAWCEKNGFIMCINKEENTIEFYKQYKYFGTFANPTFSIDTNTYSYKILIPLLYEDNVINKYKRDLQLTLQVGLPALWGW